jgi:hypothetical protein
VEFVFLYLKALFCGSGVLICLFQSLSLSVQLGRMPSYSPECRFNLRISGSVDFSTLQTYLATKVCSMTTLRLSLNDLLTTLSVLSKVLTVSIDQNLSLAPLADYEMVGRDSLPFEYSRQVWNWPVYNYVEN